MVGPNLPFGGLACGLVLGPLPSQVACVHPGMDLSQFEVIKRVVDGKLVAKE